MHTMQCMMKAMYRCICACIYLSVLYSETYVTGFAKRGLPHTSDVQTSMIHNFRCVAISYGPINCTVQGTNVA